MAYDYKKFTPDFSNPELLSVLEEVYSRTTTKTTLEDVQDILTEMFYLEGRQFPLFQARSFVESNW